MDQGESPRTTKITNLQDQLLNQKLFIHPPGKEHLSGGDERMQEDPDKEGNDEENEDVRKRPPPPFLAELRARFQKKP